MSVQVRFINIELSSNNLEIGVLYFIDFLFKVFNIKDNDKTRNIMYLWFMNHRNKDTGVIHNFHEENLDTIVKKSLRLDKDLSFLIQGEQRQYIFSAIVALTVFLLKHVGEESMMLKAMTWNRGICISFQCQDQDFDQITLYDIEEGIKRNFDERSIAVETNEQIIRLSGWINRKERSSYG